MSPLHQTHELPSRGELWQDDEKLVWCRKRPFLIRPLENTLIKLLKSLDFYDELGRDKIAIGGQHRIPPCSHMPCKARQGNPNRPPL